MKFLLVVATLGLMAVSTEGARKINPSEVGHKLKIPANCGSLSDPRATHRKEAREAADYSQHGDNWANPNCQRGCAQSPINLDQSLFETSAVIDSPIKPDLVQSSAELKVDRVTGPRQIGIYGDDLAKNVLHVLGGEVYLLNIHFHSHGEHAVDGQQSLVEGHFVFATSEGTGFAVIGVMIDEDNNNSQPENEFFKAFDFPRDGTDVTDSIAVSFPKGILNALIGDTVPKFVHYEGSLTTEPCSEPIEWFVSTIKAKVNSSQLEAFKLLRDNNGPDGSGNFRNLQKMRCRHPEVAKGTIQLA